MDILERIKDNFNRGYFGKSMVIPELPAEFPAWTIKQDNWVGVAVPMENYFPFSEQFSHVRIRSARDVFIDGIKYDVLMLITSDSGSRNEFAHVCSDFVFPGKQGKDRISLITNPASWWKNWKTLIGNVSSEKSAYDTLGEMMMVEKLLKNGYSAIWSGAEHASHDVETSEFSIEVKTTSLKYGHEVTINSIYQMIPTAGKPLYLSFIRLEPSALGRSIDDVAESLVKLGYDAAKLEEVLNQKQLEKGRPARNEKFKPIEWKKYTVDESFPTISEYSFKSNRLPQNIVRFTYTINLSGVAGENLL